MYSKNKLLNSLSGLPNDVKISNYKHVGNNILELFVDWEEPKLDEHKCPYCKGTYIIKKRFRKKETKNDSKQKVLEHNCKLIKNSQRVLVASPFNDTYWSHRYIEREDRLKEIFTISPSLKLPYEALSSFYEVENSSSSDRHQLLLDWIKTYTKCDCPPIKQAANSISKRRSAIERAWKYHKSNAKTEGLNKKIKDIKRAGFGMHDFDNFRKRILLSLGTEHVVDEFYAIHKKRAEALCNEALNGGNAHD